MTQYLFCVIFVWAGLGNATSARDSTEATALEADQSPETDAPRRTGKERLGPIWTAEQRVKNCDVPPYRRGPEPRPDACAVDRKD